MFSKIHNYIQNIYSYYSNNSKIVPINKETWVKNELILWKQKMYEENPYLNEIPNSRILDQKQKISKLYDKKFLK
jgi:hypothetical protein